MQDYFDHEKLEVYQEAIAFVAWWAEVSQSCVAPASIKDQLDRSSTSVPLNIAEGNGKYYPKDRCRYFQIARGSALESAACLDVLMARRSLTPEELHAGKYRLLKVVSMLVKLIMSVSDRAAEGGAEYELAVGSDGISPPEPPL